MNPLRSDVADYEMRFRALYSQTYREVLRFVQRRVHPGGAEDVTAEVFLTAWRRFEDLPRRPDDARSWLFGIARNSLLNDRRAQGRREALTVRIAEVADLSTGAPDDIAALRADVARAWQRLSHTDQEALSFAVFDQLTSSQAALVLGITPVSYRLRLLRARRSLRRQIEPDPHLSDAYAEAYR